MSMTVTSNDSGRVAYYISDSGEMRLSTVTTVVDTGGNTWQVQSSGDGALVVVPPDSGAAVAYWNDLQRSVENAGDNAPFDMGELLRLLIEFASAQQAQDRENRQNDLAMKIDALGAAADEVVRAAEQRFIGAMVGGAMQIGSGAINIAGSANALLTIRSAQIKIAADASAPNAAPILSDPDFQIRQFGNLTAASQNASHLGQGVGTGVQGTGQMASGGMELNASEHDKTKLGYDKTAEVDEAAHASDNDALQQHLDTQKSIAAAVAAIEQERHATAKSQAQAV